MKNILVILIALISLTAYSQDEVKKEIKKELKIENTDGKYKVTVITTENGQTKTITKTYNNLEEMKDDPEMGDMKIMSFDGKGKNVVFIGDESAVDDQEVKVIVKRLDKDGSHEDHETEINRDHNIIFKSGDENSDTHKIKVWIDEDGKKHVSKDGVELKGNTWTSEDGKTYDIKKMDGKVMIFSEDQTAEFITDDGEHIDIKVKVDGAEEGEIEKEVIIVNTTTGDDNDDNKRIVVKIVEEIKLHLEDIDENEFTDLPGIDAKILKLDDFNYYPNPNSGKFTLAFEAANKPTEIRITNVNGKEVYKEKLQSFEGSYNKEIDLGGQQPGIYLLQVLQGKKAMNKKIVIE